MSCEERNQAGDELRFACEVDKDQGNLSVIPLLTDSDADPDILGHRGSLADQRNQPIAARRSSSSFPGYTPC